MWNPNIVCRQHTELVKAAVYVRKMDKVDDSQANDCELQPKRNMDQPIDHMS